MLNSLEKLGIRSYRIENDGAIIIKQNVEWNGKGFNTIPVKFQRVEGDFSAKGNLIRDFTNFPHEVVGTMNLSYNLIESFSTYPQDSKVTHLLIDNNRLTSLEGLVNVQHLSVEGNPIISVEHAPLVSTLFISNTDITEEDLVIYKIACALGTWKQEQTLFENFKFLVRNFPVFSEKVKSYKIFRDHEKELKMTLLSIKFGL